MTCKLAARLVIGLDSNGRFSVSAVRSEFRWNANNGEQQRL
jgi:hypothetical protein